MSCQYPTSSQQLELLDFARSVIPENFFQDAFLIASQHILPALEFLLDALLSKGLLPENIAIIGKCYSSSSVSIGNLRAKGIYVSDLSLSFDSYENYDDLYKSHVQKFFEGLSDLDFTPYQRIIILDDGGDLHLEANTFFADFSKLCGVEQTSRGYNRITRFQPSYPIIAVARAKAKLNLESPLVAKAVVTSLQNQCQHHATHPRNALVIGNSAIGSAIADELSNYYAVSKFDMMPERSDFDELHLKAIAAEIDLILGCTGENLLPLLERNDLLKHRAILASCSVSDVEFGGKQLRLWTKQTFNCHDTLSVANVSLLNTGFPINFSGGDKDSIPLSKLQLTIALLLLGVFQAAQYTEKSGNLIVPLEEKMQDLLIARYTNVKGVN